MKHNNLIGFLSAFIMMMAFTTFCADAQTYSGFFPQKKHILTNAQYKAWVQDGVYPDESEIPAEDYTVPVSDGDCHVEWGQVGLIDFVTNANEYYKETEGEGYTDEEIDLAKAIEIWEEYGFRMQRDPDTKFANYMLVETDEGCDVADKYYWRLPYFGGKEDFMGLKSPNKANSAYGPGPSYTCANNPDSTSGFVLKGAKPADEEDDGGIDDEEFEKLVKIIKVEGGEGKDVYVINYNKSEGGTSKVEKSGNSKIINPAGSGTGVVFRDGGGSGTINTTTTTTSTGHGSDCECSRCCPDCYTKRGKRDGQGFDRFMQFTGGLPGMAYTAGTVAGIVNQTRYVNGYNRGMSRDITNIRINNSGSGGGGTGTVFVPSTGHANTNPGGTNSSNCPYGQCIRLDQSIGCRDAAGGCP